MEKTPAVKLFMEEGKKEGFRGNFNTILMFVMLLVMAWLGTETSSSSKGLIELKTQQQAEMRAVADSLKRLEDRENEAVARREYEAWKLATEAKIAEMSVRIREIDLILARMNK